MVLIVTSTIQTNVNLDEGELILVCNNEHIGKTCSEIISQQKLIYVDDKIRIDDYLLWQKSIMIF